MFLKEIAKRYNQTKLFKQEKLFFLSSSELETLKGLLIVKPWFRENPFQR